MAYQQEPDRLGWSDAPWWGRASVVFVAPTLMAAYLIYVLVGSIQDGQRAILVNQTTIITNQTAMIEMMSTQARSGMGVSSQLGQLQMVLTQICANAATTSAERAGCFR